MRAFNVPNFCDSSGSMAEESLDISQFFKVHAIFGVYNGSIILYLERILGRDVFNFILANPPSLQGPHSWSY